jgi:flagellar biosynthesis protein FlhA
MDSVSQAAGKAVATITEMGLQPIIICSPVLRRHLKRLVEQVSMSVMVISHSEIIQNIRIQSLGRVKL